MITTLQYGTKLPEAKEHILSFLESAEGVVPSDKLKDAIVPGICSYGTYRDARDELKEEGQINCVRSARNNWFWYSTELLTSEIKVNKSVLEYEREVMGLPDPKPESQPEPEDAPESKTTLRYPKSRARDPGWAGQMDRAKRRRKQGNN